MIAPVLDAALGLGGAALAGLAAVALYRRHRARRHGRLVATDRDGNGPRLSSERYRLVGRPDAVRRLPNGRLVPIELKHRAAPASGPWRSHRIQVATYCLLLEETTGDRPPYGVVRYSDGREFEVPWDEGARASVLEVRAAVARPYSGEATPSPAKCRACPWREGCDARAV